ncbi:MAG: TAXI family TRAP transporter solute-binding subunit [Bacillota bacterium]
MPRKLVAIVLCLSLVLFGALGCTSKASDKGSGDAASKSKEGKNVRVNIATATTAGIYYALGNAIAKVWNDQVKGLHASVQSTSGSTQNIELLARKESQVAFLQNGVAGDALNGKNVFEGKPRKDFLGMTYLYPNLCYFVVRKDSGINDLQGLRGKKIIPGPVGSGTEINTREILSIVGIDYKNNKDATANYVSNAEAAEKFSDRQADMAFIAGGIPHASVTEMMTRGEAKILEIKGEVRDKLMQKYPAYFPIEVPANSYKGQSEPVQTVAVANILVCSKDLDEKLVYDMLKSLYDNKDVLANTYKEAASFQIKNGLNGMTVPLHPGAVKFFEDHGVKVPEHLKPKTT